MTRPLVSPHLRLGIVALALTAALPASALDVSSDLAPLEIQDANPAAPGSRSLDVGGRFQRSYDGKTEWRSEPKLKLGLAEDAQLDLGVSVVGGQTDQGSGDLSARLLYRLHRPAPESRMPALAISVRTDLSSGLQSSGVDTELRLLMSRELSPTGQGHLNLLWLHDTAARDGNRKQRYGLMLGYAHAISGKTHLVSDLVVRQHPLPGKVESIVEFGWRHAPAKDAVLGAGLGVGANEDAPRFRLLVSLQRGF